MKKLLIILLFASCTQQPTYVQNVSYDLWKENAIHRAVLDSLASGFKGDSIAEKELRKQITEKIKEDSVVLGWKIQSGQ
jgi:hypothetical protein